MSPHGNIDSCTTYLYTRKMCSIAACSQLVRTYNYIVLVVPALLIAVRNVCSGSILRNANQSSSSTSYVEPAATIATSEMSRTQDVQQSSLQYTLCHFLQQLLRKIPVYGELACRPACTPWCHRPSSELNWFVLEMHVFETHRLKMKCVDCNQKQGSLD